MRDGSLRGLALFSAAIAAVGLVEVRGEDPSNYYAVPAPPAAIGSDYYASAPRGDELHRLMQRVDALESELDGYRRQRQAQLTSTVESNNRLTALEDLSQQKAAVEASKPKEVPIITAPTPKIFGRIFFDQDMFDNDGLTTVAASPFTQLEEETGFRTIRLGANGNVYENIKFQVEFEFEGSEVDYKDNYIEANELGWWGYNIRGGFFKEPYSLEEIESGRFLTFMERSIPHGAFVPSRNFGVMAYDYLGDNQDVSWFLGAFRDGSVENPSSRGSYVENAGDWCADCRVAWNPYYDEPSGGRYLCHIGGAYSYRTVNTESLTFTTKQELGTQSGYLQVVIPDDDNYSLYGLESLIIWGPASFQAEYYQVDTGEFSLWGAYMQVGYFLTGESIGYRRDFKCPDRTKPFEDFFCVRTANGICKGIGAWQVAARWSFADLDDAGLTTATRGEQTDFTLGVNWWWNAYTRMMFNYVYNDVDRFNAQGQPQFAGIRWQIDF